MLDQAADLKARGASDDDVVDYLHAYQASLPPIIEARDIRTLRKAGAGQSVVTWLSRVAAVDIGETGEGREAARFRRGPLPNPRNSPTASLTPGEQTEVAGCRTTSLPAIGTASSPHPSHHMRGLGRSQSGRAHRHRPVRPSRESPRRPRCTHGSPIAP